MRKAVSELEALGWKFVEYAKFKYAVTRPKRGEKPSPLSF
jgi:hypothetical protein